MSAQNAWIKCSSSNLCYGARRYVDSGPGPSQQQQQQQQPIRVSDGECVVNAAGGVGRLGAYGDVTRARVEVNRWRRVVITVKCEGGGGGQSQPAQVPPSFYAMSPWNSSYELNYDTPETSFERHAHLTVLTGSSLAFYIDFVTRAVA